MLTRLPSSSERPWSTGASNLPRARAVGSGRVADETNRHEPTTPRHHVWAVQLRRQGGRSPAFGRLALSIKNEGGVISNDVG
jgi:hypothetical protein